MLRLIGADDGYEPSRTVATMKQLDDREQVFGYVGNIGTASAAIAIHYTLQRRMLFFAAYTGATWFAVSLPIATCSTTVRATRKRPMRWSATS